MTKKTRVERRAAWLRQRGGTRTKRRKCVRCGKVGYYAPYETACQQLIGMLGAYRCPGKLAAIPRKPTRTLKEGIVAMLTEPDQPSRYDAARAEARKRMEDAGRRWLDAKVRFNRYVSNLRRFGTKKWALKCATAAQDANKWSRKALYYEKLAQMTDAQLDAEVAHARRSFAPRPKRGIKIGGDV